MSLQGRDVGKERSKRRNEEEKGHMLSEGSSWRGSLCLHWRGLTDGEKSGQIRLGSRKF